MFVLVCHLDWDNPGCQGGCNSLGQPHFLDPKIFVSV